MDAAAYLRRIDYTGLLAPTAETLRQLHLSHLRTVPFENLSIHHGEMIVLNDEALFDKIVTRRRGGFCYELNGLFAALLKELGFEVTKLSARVVNSEDELGEEFDHMTLRVVLEENWLADVGFGDSFLEPLRLYHADEQPQGERSYRIVKEGDQRFMQQRSADSEWRTQYQFSLTPYEYPDYEGMCQHHQTSPASHFTRNKICSRATKDGRITLSGMKLIETSGNARTEQLLSNDREYTEALQTHFGIVLK